jgi:hypothetical protein
MFNDLMREVIVHFVGIDGIVDHQAANTNFIVFGLNRPGLKLTIYRMRRLP